MTTLPGTAATTPNSQPSDHLTLRWLARRSALLVVILAAGIGAACCLYAFAGDAPTTKEFAARSIKP